MNGRTIRWLLSLLHRPVGTSGGTAARLTVVRHQVESDDVAVKVGRGRHVLCPQGNHGKASGVDGMHVSLHCLASQQSGGLKLAS